MTTLAPDNLVGLAHDIEDVPDLPSATNSGIVGDLAHKIGGGYHISIEDQPADNYSVKRPNDKAPPGNWPRNQAAANDTSMSTADMVKVWNRMFVVWLNQNDPRRKYFNAVNGWNGKGDAERLDFVANTRTVATSDHKWHTHDETPRRYVNDPEARRAKSSVYHGESIVQYMTGTGRSANTANGGSVGQQVLVKDNTGKYWLCDGMFRRYIGTTAADVAGQGNGQSHQSGYLGNIGNGGVPIDFGTTPEGMNGWGIDVATLGGALTPAIVQQIVTGVSAAVIAADTNELTTADLANVKAAAAVGVNEAMANLEITATVGVGHTTV